MLSMSESLQVWGMHIMSKSTQTLSPSSKTLARTTTHRALEQRHEARHTLFRHVRLRVCHTADRAHRVTYEILIAVRDIGLKLAQDHIDVVVHSQRGEHL